MKKKTLIIISALLAMLLLVYLRNYVYFPLDGIVVDAETNKPIDGAVVLAVWTIQRGIPGLYSTETYRTVETVTDQNGRFKINAYVLHPFVNKPDLTIYKAGYVCWNNRYVFPGNKHREGFIWRGNSTYALEKFTPSYSYTDHVSFVGTAAFLKGAGYFKDAFSWELEKASKELSGRK